MTTSDVQAISWANRRYRRTSRQRTSYLYSYRLSEIIDPASGFLDILELLTYDEKWLDFICKNRLQDLDSSHDIVYDRIADNRYQNISETVTAYSNHKIRPEEAIEKLRWNNAAGDQYCFKTKRAIELLELIRKIPVST